MINKKIIKCYNDWLNVVNETDFCRQVSKDIDSGKIDMLDNKENKYLDMIEEEKFMGNIKKVWIRM